MKFCGSCENLLYPESDERRAVVYRCHCCGLVEPYDGQPELYTVSTKKDEALSTVGDKLPFSVRDRQLIAELANDPTAPRGDGSEACAACGNVDVAFFINPLVQTNEEMAMVFACPCGNVWRQKN